MCDGALDCKVESKNCLYWGNLEPVEFPEAVRKIKRECNLRPASGIICSEIYWDGETKKEVSFQENWLTFPLQLCYVCDMY